MPCHFIYSAFYEKQQRIKNERAAVARESSRRSGSPFLLKQRGASRSSRVSSRSYEQRTNSVRTTTRVLVLVLDDSTIGDANGAVEQERFWAMAPPPPAPFRFTSPSCFRMVAACELACRIHRRQTPGSSLSCMSASSCKEVRRRNGTSSEF